MSDINSRVKAIIVDKLGVDEGEVVADASFTNDLGADSLDTVELIMEFEKEFDIQIPDDQAENIATVGQAIQFIEQEKYRSSFLNHSRGKALPRPSEVLSGCHCTANHGNDSCLTASTIPSEDWDSIWRPLPKFRIP